MRLEGAGLVHDSSVHSFLSMDGVVDLLAVIGPDPGLLLEVDLELIHAPNKVPDVGRIAPGVSGEVFAGGELLLLPGSQRHLDPDEGALPELPHEGVGLLQSPELFQYACLPPSSYEEVVGLLDVLDSLLLVPHGAVDDHVQEHLMLGALMAQVDGIIVTIFGESVT